MILDTSVLYDVVVDGARSETARRFIRQAEALLRLRLLFITGGDTGNFLMEVVQGHVLIGTHTVGNADVGREDCDLQPLFITHTKDLP